MTPQEYRAAIFAALPEGSVETAHTDRGHFYKVPAIGKTFPSVTGKLQILKDESLINYKANRTAEFVFANWKKFTDENIIDYLERAKNVSADVLKDAGDIGTLIHDCREKFFRSWIDSGVKPPTAKAFIPPECPDLRVLSAMRALDKFCEERRYVPVVSELYLYDDQFELGGALDDIGVMPKVLREGNPDCLHAEMMVSGQFSRCMLCPLKEETQLVLLDVKTSNQFKDHYFFQVALYYMMFVRLTNLKPKTVFILKLSKEDGTYKIEELRGMPKLVGYAKHMLKTHEALAFIKSTRKDNQKTVLTL